MLDKILAFIAEKLEGMPGRMRPVGSIYLSLDPTNPSKGSRTFYVDATHEHSSVGSDQSHNNLPPYLAVYIWKRIA